jgi:hypothetical protein
MALHDSGKILIATYKNCLLKMWNLMTAKSAFSKKLKEPAEGVKWANDGVTLIIRYSKKVQVYHVENDEELGLFEFDTGITSIDSLNDDTLLCSGENGCVYIVKGFKSPLDRELYCFETDLGRLKEVKVAKDEIGGTFFIAYSTVGKVGFWRENALLKKISKGREEGEGMEMIELEPEKVIDIDRRVLCCHISLSIDSLKSEIESLEEKVNVPKKTKKVRK